VARNDGRPTVSHYPDHQAHPDAEAADFPASKCLDRGGTVQSMQAIRPSGGSYVATFTGMPIRRMLTRGSI
jgi:hypothetical protein